MTDVSMACPRCGLVNVASAEVCDCGYNFVSRQMSAQPTSEHDIPKQQSRWGSAAFVLLSLAVFVLLLLLGTTDTVLSGAVMTAILGSLLAGPLYLWWLKPSRTKRLLKAGSWGAYSLVVFIVLFGPDFLRSRVSANESATVSNLRTLIFAQDAYRKVAGAYAPNVGCLRQPNTCLKDYHGAALLEEAARTEGLTSGHVSGYLYAWSIVPLSGGEGAERYAITATPSQPGDSGVRGFCGDSTGVLCFSRTGEAPPVRDGFCQIAPTTCEVLT